MSYPETENINNTLKDFSSNNSNNSDDNEMLRQMRLLYCRSNRLFRMFNKCSKHVLIELCRSFCTTFYCPYFWTAYKKTTFSKIRVAYNNVYRKLLGLCRRSSVSEMFAMNNISNFEALIKRQFLHLKLVCQIQITPLYSHYKAPGL